MDPLKTLIEHLIDAVEQERDTAAEFRDEIRKEICSLDAKIGIIDQRFAIQDAVQAENKRKRKVAAGVVGTLIALLGAIVPFLVK